MVKSPAGPRYIRNLTTDLDKQPNHDVDWLPPLILLRVIYNGGQFTHHLELSRSLDLVQMEITRCQKGQWEYFDIFLPDNSAYASDTQLKRRQKPTRLQNYTYDNPDLPSLPRDVVPKIHSNYVTFSIEFEPILHGEYNWEFIGILRLCLALTPQ